MQKRIDLRLALAADIPTVQGLAHRIWWNHYPGIISAEQIAYMLQNMYDTETLLHRMTAEGEQFWLIQSATREDIGFISVRQQAAQQYFIQKFYIDIEQQGKGIGAEAFERLLEHYADAREIRLTVNRQNYKSINFYFKIGFRIERCADFDIGGGFFMNDFVMCWKRPA